MLKISTRVYIYGNALALPLLETELRSGGRGPEIPEFVSFKEEEAVKIRGRRSIIPTAVSRKREEVRNSASPAVLFALISVTIFALASPQGATAAYQNCNPACNHLGPQARCSCVPPYFHTTCGAYWLFGCGPGLAPLGDAVEAGSVALEAFSQAAETCSAPLEAAGSGQPLSQAPALKPQLDLGGSPHLMPMAWYPPPSTCIQGLACSVPEDCPGGTCFDHTTLPYPWISPRTCICVHPY